MRDPYLYDDADVLINLADIKDPELLHKAEADITNLAMTSIYNQQYEKFNTDTLKDIHRTIFGQIYDWAGERGVPHHPDDQAGRRFRRRHGALCVSQGN